MDSVLVRYTAGRSRSDVDAGTLIVNVDGVLVRYTAGRSRSDVDAGTLIVNVDGVLVKYTAGRSRSDVDAGTLIVNVTLPASLLATQMYIPNSLLSELNDSTIRVPSFSRLGSAAAAEGWRSGSGSECR